MNYTKDQAFEAMQALIDGVYDNPQLLKLGPLSLDENEDLRRIFDGIELEIEIYTGFATAKHVTSFTVTDPDTGNAVSLSVYKEVAGGMFAVDSSYLDDEDNPVYSPVGNGILDLED